MEPSTTSEQRVAGWHRMGHAAGMSLGMPLAYFICLFSAPNTYTLYLIGLIVLLELAVGLTFYLRNRKSFALDG
jgi:hypothetical protein